MIHPAERDIGGILFSLSNASPTSSMDWCEENYAQSHYIAEWWNTLTNLNYIFLSFLGFWSFYRTRSEPRSFFPYLGTLCVGVGSWFFHMTLTYQMQLSDELPMIWGTSFYLYCIANVNRDNNWTSIIIIGLYCLLLTVYYVVTFDWAFFEKAFATLVVSSFLVPMYHIWNLSAKFPNHTREFIILLCNCSLGYIVGVVFWTTDNVYCDTLRSLRHDIKPFGFLLQFHGWWHLCTGISAYTSDVFAQYMRLIVIGRTDVRLKWFGPYPIVVLKDKQKSN
ncbi:ceramidase [Globomyces pollinis-pini]|nr:ceramidase [Globomyces pollinis-pini]